VGRRTVDAYICDGRGRANRGDGGDDCGSGNFGNFDVDLRNVSAAECNRNGMATRIARLGFHFRLVFVDTRYVMIRIRQLGIVMLV
jgi:hypothetical protein